MKIALYSDTHTEFGNDFPEIPYGVDVVVLAGDDVVGDGYGELEDFICENRDVQIVMVAGNHNYYGLDFDSVNKTYGELAKQYSHFHFLNDSVFEYQGVVFHGCTLWTDFSSKGEAWKQIGMMEAKRGIADFHRIRYKGAKYITPEDMVGLHNNSLQWLSKSLQEHSGKVNVVVTHFPPIVECTHPIFSGGSVLDAYFNNDLGELVYKHKPQWWFYGHNHWSDEFTAYGTRFVSNQKGYPDERTEYCGDKIITI